jgi:hypothetical protein
MPDSEALKKLKKEVEVKEEWIFKIFDKPPGLTVDHMGEAHQLAEKELRDLMRGYLKGEYFMDVVYDPKEKAYVHVLKIIDLSRYKWLPRYLYKKFLKCVCEVLDIPYRPQMLDAVTAQRLTAKARIAFAEKKLWDLAEERAKELAERYERIYEEIAGLEKFFKEEKKKK